MVKVNLKDSSLINTIYLLKNKVYKNSFVCERLVKCATQTRQWKEEEGGEAAE